MESPAIDERSLLSSFSGVNEIGKSVEISLGDAALTVSTHGEAPRSVSFDHLVCYDGRPVKDEGPDWSFRFRTVSWKWVLIGKSLTDFEIRLSVPEEFKTTDLNREKAFCMQVLFSIDKRVLKWMRVKTNANQAPTVASVSLLRPQVGVEAALVAIKRESESEIAESNMEFLGNNLADMSIVSSPRDRSAHSPRV
jgi:hypothetical protein